MKAPEVITSPFSFRDPAGHVFQHEGQHLRRVSPAYLPILDQMVESGLYNRLVTEKLLVSYADCTDEFPALAAGGRILRPRQIPYISYAAEWCFSQLKSSALATLRIQQLALEHGMILKDATSANIQFIGHQPVWIDTLSFVPYQDRQPWLAYRQFCQHFLAPLALMARRDVRLGLLLNTFPDGLPLDLASQLLPRSSWLSRGLLMHVHLHAQAQERFKRQDAPVPPQPEPRHRNVLSRQALLAMVESLARTVRSEKRVPGKSTWSRYEDSNSYLSDEFQKKDEIVSRFCTSIDQQINLVLDLGANTGHFSRLIAESGRLSAGATIVSVDQDHEVVERNFQSIVTAGKTDILPLVINLASPTAAGGWNCSERSSFPERKYSDLVLSLALFHHLVIAHGISLEMIAQFLRRAGRWHIVEFVDKADPQCQRLLASREDIFEGYTQAGFERVFGDLFEIVASEQVGVMRRRIYLLKSR